MSKTTWSISELAKEFDITTRSIRFYEDQGLLTPTRKGQTRVYSKQDRVRLKLTLRGKRLGFSLADTRELFAIYDDTATNNDKQLTLMINIVHDKLATLEQQLQDLQIVRSELLTAEKRCWDSMSQEGRHALEQELDYTFPAGQEHESEMSQEP